MRLIPTALVVGTVLVLFQSPQLISNAKDALTDDQPGNAVASTETQKTYARLCPLAEVWSDMDTEGRRATAQTMERLARKQAKTTDDPALQAFLAVVPRAFSNSNSVQARAAKALIDRECTAYGF